MRRSLCAMAAALVILTLAYTWPLAPRAGHAVAHDTGDPLLVTWILAWDAHATPLTTRWWNAPAFFPSTGVTAFSETFLGEAVLSAPVEYLTRNPVLAYNVAFLFSYLACGLSGFVLAFVVTGDRWGASVAALAFAFAPYRLSHLQHLQLLSSYWMPLALAALHQYVRDRRARWAWMFGAAWLLQALACGYYLFFLTIFAGLWLLVFGRRRSLDRAAIVRLATAFACAAFVFSPVLIGYYTIQSRYGFRRSPIELDHYSADIAGLWSSAPESLVWHGLHGTAAAESLLFPGLTVVVLAVIAVWSPARRNKTTTFYIGAAVLMWLLALGPHPALYGRPIGVAGPYALLARLPGFEGIRVPARFWMLSVLSLSVVAALAVAQLSTTRVKAAAVILACAGILLDGWPRTFPIVTVPRQVTTDSGAVARLGLPLRETEAETMYGSTSEWRPVYNGYSGYDAPQHAALRYLLERRDPRVLRRLTRDGSIEVIIDTLRDPDGIWERFVEAYPGFARLAGGAGWHGYVLPHAPATAAPPANRLRIAIARVTATINQHDIGAVIDGDLESRWNVPAQMGGETIELDLGTTTSVSELEMCLGRYPGQFPRGLLIDVSPDATAWTPAFAGDVALQTYDGALREPREVPVALPIHREGIRFIRLHQTERSPEAGWSIVELRAFR